MKRMTRAAAALLAIVLLLCLAGCQKGEVVGGSADDSSAPAPTPEATATPQPANTPEPTAAPQTEASEEGLAIFGEWSEDHIYTNDVFGLQYTLPDTWIYATQEEILSLSQITLESGLLTEKEVDALQAAQTLFIMLAQDPLTGNNALMLTENMAGLPGASMMDEERYAQLTIASLTQGDREVKVEAGETSWAEIASMDFLVLPIQITYGDFTVQQMTYIRRIGDRMLSIGITSMDGTPIEELPGGIGAFSAL